MEYVLIYSDRKTVSISVRGGQLTVRAPKRTSKRRIEQILEKHSRWIEKHLQDAKKHFEKFDNLSFEEITILKKEAREYLVAKTEEYAKLLGLKYGRITITSAKTRFGSCSDKGNISYSYKLMLCPVAAREYVVVHELCHLVEMNHSKKFYQMVEKVFPDYKERRRMLK